jgi:peptide/nickel transport system substrate-binding protein
VTEGATIPFIVSTGTAPGGVEWATIAASIQADLAQIGINLDIQQMQQSELLTKYRAQELPMLLMNWGPDYTDPDANGTPFANYEAQSLAWRNSWNDPQAIELSKQAAVELDPAKRVELYGNWSTTCRTTAPSPCSSSQRASTACATTCRASSTIRATRPASVCG